MANLHRLEAHSVRQAVEPAGIRASSAGPSLTVARSLDEAADAWYALEAWAATPFQTLDWHRAMAAEAQAVIAIGYDAGGDPVFLIPLALERQGPVRLFRWLAGPQASYGGGLFRPDFAASLDGEAIARLLERIAAAAPRADAYVLDDQRDDMGGNPLALLPRIAGAGEGYSVTLGPWEAVYAARSNRRARHNDRRRERRLAELAPWHVGAAEGDGERTRLMGVLFAQKRAWMRERGIEDFLADDATRARYLRLATMAGGAVEPVINVLDVGGESAAVSFGLIHGGSYYSLITSTTEDERLHAYSPGDVLFRHVLEAMCGRGLEHYDLGIGHTPQKEHYADRRFRVFHTLVPLTVEGRIYTAAMRAHFAAKRAIKESTTLWDLFQQARRLRGAIGGYFAPKAE